MLNSMQFDGFLGTKQEHSDWPTHSHSSGPKSKTQALALGLGSLLNHSVHGQNVGWKKDLESACITYIALRDIHQGEELCINYGKLWFQDVDSLDPHTTSESEDFLRNIVADGYVDGEP